VLIPRPETEFLVVTLLDLARQRPASEAVDVCDVGTGSGALAVCIARHLPSARVLGLDVSRGALDVAAENVGEHGVAERVELLQSDLFADVAPQRTFDFIVSNPPYVSEAEYERLAPEVREHEPRGALVAGRQGTEVIARLVAEAADRLNAQGSLLIEVSPMIHEAAVELIQAEPRLEVGPTVKDLSRQPRVVQAKKA
jgi:release factor glutamine methyltransferase